MCTVFARTGNARMWLDDLIFRGQKWWLITVRFLLGSCLWNGRLRGETLERGWEEKYFFLNFGEILLWYLRHVKKHIIVGAVIVSVVAIDGFRLDMFSLCTIGCVVRHLWRGRKKLPLSLRRWWLVQRDRKIRWTSCWNLSHCSIVLDYNWHACSSLVWCIFVENVLSTSSWSNVLRAIWFTMHDGRRYISIGCSDLQFMLTEPLLFCVQGPMWLVGRVFCVVVVLGCSNKGKNRARMMVVKAETDWSCSGIQTPFRATYWILEKPFQHHCVTVCRERQWV